MPRLRQVPKDEATAPIVTTMYEWLFEGRDPVAEPGRWDGTTGDWWTVFANSPDILDHCVKGFGLYQSPDRTHDPAERAVLAYTDCLVYDLGRVPDELFAELQRHLDEVAIIELTYI